MKRLSLFALTLLSAILLSFTKPAASDTTPRLVLFEAFMRPT